MNAELQDVIELESTAHVPDTRRINHMDSDTKAVHYELERWGRWARDAGIRAWPQVTLLGRIIEEGLHGARSTGAPPVSMPSEVERVDKAVAHLGEVDRRVIRKYYLEWAPPEVMAKSLKMRRREFDNVLRRARYRVQGYIAALLRV